MDKLFNTFNNTNEYTYEIESEKISNYFLTDSDFFYDKFQVVVDNKEVCKYNIPNHIDKKDVDLVLKWPNVSTDFIFGKIDIIYEIMMICKAKRKTLDQLYLKFIRLLKDFNKIESQKIFPLINLVNNANCYRYCILHKIIVMFINFKYDSILNESVNNPSNNSNGKNKYNLANLIEFLDTKNELNKLSNKFFIDKRYFINLFDIDIKKYGIHNIDSLNIEQFKECFSKFCYNKLSIEHFDSFLSKKFDQNNKDQIKLTWKNCYISGGFVLGCLSNDSMLKSSDIDIWITLPRYDCIECEDTEPIIYNQQHKDRYEEGFEYVSPKTFWKYRSNIVKQFINFFQDIFGKDNIKFSYTKCVITLFIAGFERNIQLILTTLSIENIVRNFDLEPVKCFYDGLNDQVKVSTLFIKEVHEKVVDNSFHMNCVENYVNSKSRLEKIIKKGFKLKYPSTCDLGIYNDNKYYFPSHDEMKDFEKLKENIKNEIGKEICDETDLLKNFQYCPFNYFPGDYDSNNQYKILNNIEFNHVDDVHIQNECSKSINNEEENTEMHNILKYNITIKYFMAKLKRLIYN